MTPRTGWLRETIRRAQDRSDRVPDWAKPTLHRPRTDDNTDDNTWEIQTCTDYLGSGESRHRWSCFRCGQRGPAEVDGHVCKQQAAHHDCRPAPKKMVVEIYERAGRILVASIEVESIHDFHLNYGTHQSGYEIFCRPGGTT